MSKVQGPTSKAKPSTLGLWTLDFGLWTSRSFVDQAQSFQRQSLVNFLDEFRTSGNQWRETAGGNHSRRTAKLIDHFFENAVDQADVAVIKAGLHRFHRRRSDDFLRTLDFHARQLRSPIKQSVGRNGNPGRDHSAHIFAVGIDRVESRRRPKINDDARRAIFVNGRNRIDYAVRADVCGRLIENRDAGINRVIDKQWRQIENRSPPFG